MFEGNKLVCYSTIQNKSNHFLLYYIVLLLPKLYGPLKMSQILKLLRETLYSIALHGQTR